MSTGLFAQTERHAAALVRRPRRRLVLAITAGVCIALSFALQMTAYLAETPLPTLLRLLHSAAVIVGFGGIGLVAVHAMGRMSEPRPRVLWTLALVVAAVLAVGFALDWLIVPPELTDEERLAFGFLKNAAPGSFRTVVLMMVAATAQVVIALFLLVRMRDFVLWRRTPVAARFWRWMLLGILAYALTLEVFGDAFTTALNGYVHTGAQIVVAMLIGANLIRLSWVLYLSFREKLLTMAALLTLLITLIFAIDSRPSLLLDTSGGLLAHFSPGVQAFTASVYAFAIAYSLVTFLLLLFHLPTATDFERREGGRQAFVDFNRLIGQAFNVQQLGDAIVEAPVRGGAADRAWLALVDDAAVAPQIIAAHGVPVEDAAKVVDAAAFLHDAQDDGLPIQLDEALADLRVRHRIGVPVGSLLAVPLVARDEVLGMLFAARSEPFGFTADDRRTLQALAAQATLALDHSRLFESRVEKERLQRELDIARSVQQRLLPQRLPDVPRLLLSATSVPALEVGGDYYDAVVLEDGRLGVIVGDVSGKGTSAAFYMAELKGVFRALALEQTSPAAFLKRAHRALALAPGTFVSALYTVFDPATGTATMARAGHCPAILVPSDGSAPVEVRAPGLGLGLDHGGAFDRALRDVTVTLAPGDSLVLYTDGLVESRSPDGEEYGYERLLSAVACHRCHDADRLHRAVIDDLHTFLAGEPYADDLTLVVMTWLGEPADIPAELPELASADVSAP